MNSNREWRAYNISVSKSRRLCFIYFDCLWYVVSVFRFGIGRNVYMLADAAAAAVVGWVWFFFSLVPKLQLAFIALRVHFNFPIFWLIAQKWLSSWLAGFIRDKCNFYNPFASKLMSIWELLGFAFCQFIACNMLSIAVCERVCVSPWFFTISKGKIPFTSIIMAENCATINFLIAIRSQFKNDETARQRVRWKWKMFHLYTVLNLSTHWNVRTFIERRLITNRNPSDLHKCWKMRNLLVVCFESDALNWVHFETFYIFLFPSEN